MGGGGAVTLADVPGAVHGGAWNADGTIVLGVQRASPTHGVHAVSATGGLLVPLLPLEPGAFLHAVPLFLPDGRRFIYLSWAFDEARRELCLGSLDDHSSRCLGIKAYDLAGITRDGYLVYAHGNTLFAQRFDTQAGRPAGEPFIIAEGLWQDQFGQTAVSMAGEGTLVYQMRAPGQQLRQFMWVGRDGRVIGPVGEPGGYGHFDVTARGDFILAERQVQAGGIALWLTDVTRGVTTRVAFTTYPTAPAPRGLLKPAFAGDSSRFFHQIIRDSGVVVLEAPIRGGEERLAYAYAGSGSFVLADVSDDGRWLGIGVAEPGRRYAAAVPREGGDPVVFAEGAVNLESSRFSPDARWIAYDAGGGAGQPEVYVVPFQRTGERWQVSSGGGLNPEWRRDGKELYYRTLDGTLMAVPVTVDGAVFDAGVPKALFGNSQLGFRVSDYRVTMDGERFLLSAPHEEGAAARTTTLQVVLNWTAGVK